MNRILFFIFLLLINSVFAISLKDVETKKYMAIKFANSNLAIKDISVVTSNWDYDFRKSSVDAFDIKVATGLDFIENGKSVFQMELEISANNKHQIELKNGVGREKSFLEIQKYSTSLNFIYGLKTIYSYTIFFGAGAGISYLFIDNITYGNPNNQGGTDEFAVASLSPLNYTFFAGVNYVYNYKLSYNINYRFTKIGDILLKKGENKINANLFTTDIVIGVKYNF
jgi:opacity protein-like surface antigen